ncbi:MAG: hypothetical protein AAFX46_20065, partial [Cyanobacteria bacterium J06636_27]
LKSEGVFPERVYQRKQAIIKKSKTVYGVGVSGTTLYKEEYLPLWHPFHENREDVNSDSTVEKYPILPDPWDTASEEPKSAPERVWESLHVVDFLDEAGKKPKPLGAEAFKGLHVIPHYEGLCLPPAQPVLEVEESASEEEKPQVGEPKGEAGGVVTGFSEEQQPQVVSDLVEIPTGNLNPGIIFLNGTIFETSSIREIINSKSTKFSIHQVILGHDFEQFIDNENLSTTGGDVSPNIDNSNLSFTQTVCSLNTEAAPEPSISPEPTVETSKEAYNPSSYEKRSDDFSTSSSPSQTPQEESSNSPPLENVPQSSTTAEHFSSSNNSEEVLASLEHRSAIHFEFKAQKKAKKHSCEFFALKNIRL